MTVKLFKNSKVDGVTRLGNWSSKSEQISYFDTLVAKTYEVPTVKLGAPLRINDKLNNLLGYGYGCIDYGDGFRYYFSVADLEMVTETITNISYTIDVYDTAKTQTNMSIKRATISRYPSAIGKTVIPYSEDYTIRTKLSTNKSWDIIALYRDSTTNVTKTLVKNNATFEDFVSGAWLESAFLATNVISAGIVMDSWTDTELQEYGFEQTGTTWVLNDTAIMTCHRPYDGTLINDGTTWHEICDLRGNVVFTVPYGTALTYQGGVVDISATSINLKYLYTDTEGTKYWVTIPSEIPTVIADAWQEYYTRQRSIDCETRNLQMNQQLVSGIASSATGAVGGAVGGSMAGMGAGVGAIAGVATGIVSAVGNYAVSAYYSPKQQAIIDKSYHYANDTISMVGGASALLFFSEVDQGVIKVEWDSKVTQAYANDINNNGYYVNYATSNFDGMLTDGPIQATVEVQGDIPIVWKEQITNRFANGVYLV